MRNLDEINSAAKSTASIFSISLILPIFMGWLTWAMATGAAPTVALRANYLAMFGLAISAISILLFPIPFLFRWDWRACFYGSALFGLGSFAWVGITPLLCLVTLSHMAITFRILILVGYVIPTMLWCFRFIKIYRIIYANKALFQMIYTEEDDRVYFLQQGDRQVLEKVLRFSQFPPNWAFILAVSTATILAFFRLEIIDFIGVPFLQIFLTISMLPVSLAFLGLATKMWLIFFTYPRKIKTRLGKTTYVDMVSKPIV